MKIALLGDMAFYGKYSIDNKNIFNYFYDVAEKLKEFDYVIGNLETPFCDNGTQKGFKSAYIKAGIRNVEVLKFLNIDAVNLANNHMFDYGIEGYESTKKSLEENNVEYFGIENKQILIEKNNNKIAFSGYCCYSTNALGYYDFSTGKGINVLDSFKVEEKMLQNDEEGYFNITSFHIGQEHVNYPNYDHVKMARLFAQKVPYVFYGHHPHVIQGIEKTNESLIAYSLGNFCFDDVYTSKSKLPLIKQSDENKKSFILALTFDNNQIRSYETIPLYATKDKLEVGSDMEIVEQIQQYSSFLKANKEEYISKRSGILNNYINVRKKKRDFNWLIKRLNINSVGMIMNSKKNIKKYNQYVLEYILEDAVK